TAPYRGEQTTRLTGGHDWLLEQRAWHGSPHVFDYFSLDAIGTGEGAQAHGWGLYFAKNQKVGVRCVLSAKG
ncbi:MAG: hypothetical protein ACTTJE_09625, partial [Schwartzia sp. (in: firmicutes)]